MKGTTSNRQSMVSRRHSQIHSTSVSPRVSVVVDDLSSVTISAPPKDDGFQMDSLPSLLVVPKGGTLERLVDILFLGVEAFSRRMNSSESGQPCVYWPAGTLVMKGHHTLAEKIPGPFSPSVPHSISGPSLTYTSLSQTLPWEGKADLLEKNYKKQKRSRELRSGACAADGVHLHHRRRRIHHQVPIVLGAPQTLPG